jgi:rod shape-determining protein MreD
MKKKFVYCLLLFGAIVLQTSVLPVISSSYAMGDIVLMLVLVGAIIDGFFSFFSWAIFAGILYDLITYSTVGIHAIIFLFVVYFVSFFSRRFSIELRGVGVLLFALFIVFATLISRLIISFSIAWDSQLPVRYLRDFGNLKIVSIQIACNIFLFLFCFFVFNKVKKFFSIE